MPGSNRTPLFPKATFRCSRRTFLTGLALAGCARLAPGSRSATALIGYTEYRTNLATRYDNQITSRACLVAADGSNCRQIGSDLVNEPYAWTQFAGWSPDGSFAVIGRGWETPENGAWEEANKTFRMTEGWLYDMFLMDMSSGALTNVTAVERVSDYNTGIIFYPDGTSRLGFTALLNGISHPFVMDRDGRNKRNLTEGKEGFTYGFSASPDGTRVAYHKDYEIYVANTDGTDTRRVDTGNPFNFVPQWSPDSQWLLFVSGEHYNCHPHICRADGSELHKLADRGGYVGWTPVYDVFDFHNGSSDVPVWSADGSHVYYTAKVNGAVELMRVSLEGASEQLTHSAPGVAHYHPKPSPDGARLLIGSNRTGTRQLYVLPSKGGGLEPITDVAPGAGAMWGHWRP